MLRIDDLSYSVEGRPLFVHASATIPAGHKVGLVGRNGSGKTTLFRLIRGEVVPEAGSIALPARTRIGGVDQEVPGSGVPILDTVLAADTERAALLAEATTAADPDRIAEIQTRLADIDAWSAEGRAAAILRGLGFTEADLARPCADFSGGWRMRVALAGVLFAAPDLLLLDEPTNYLDLEGALWLEGYLARYPHSVLVISHDRGLLNRAVGAILHLENRNLTLYSGGYDVFAATRAARLAVQAAEARKQEARRAHMQAFVDRFRYKASKARQAQSRLKLLEKMTPLASPEEARATVFTFPAPEPIAPPILALDGVAAGYGGQPVLRRLTLRIDADDRIALLGRNGEGKSTLARLLAGRLEPIEGRILRPARLRVGYFAQHQVDELDLAETPLDHIRRLRPDEPPARLRARLAGFGLLAEQAGTAVARLSGGQKSRLALMLATNAAPHLLILDEPTNHLDIESREGLVEALTEYPGAVVIVSHDMHLLSLVADRLWLVKGGGVRPYTGDLEGYRAELLAAEPKVEGRPPPAPAPGGRAGREALADLRAEVRRCEAVIGRLVEIRDRLAAQLADPALYAPGRSGDATGAQRRYAEVVTGIDRAERAWLEAQERLEAAGG